jgi:hypothetical protein
VKAVGTARKEKRLLELPWLAAAAGVEPARQVKLGFHAPSAMQVVARSEGLLRFYGALTPAQRTDAATEAGLPATKLSSEQRQRLEAVVRRLAPAWPPDMAARSTVRLQETKAAARWVFTSDAGTVETTVTFPSPAASPFGGPSGFGSGPPRFGGQ